jgi:hypothetical protein
MATTFDDVARLALALPAVAEGTRFNHRTWFVGDPAVLGTKGAKGARGFAWERPFSKADLKRFGNDVPATGPILAVSVGDLVEKEAVLAMNTPGLFTIEHFNNYPAILVALDQVAKKTLKDLIVDAWLACAPRPLAEAYLAARKS